MSEKKSSVGTSCWSSSPLSVISGDTNPAETFSPCPAQQSSTCPQSASRHIPGAAVPRAVMPMGPDSLQCAAAKSCEEGNYAHRKGENNFIEFILFCCYPSVLPLTWSLKISYRNGLNCSQPCKKGTNSRLKITANGKQSETEL